MQKRIIMTALMSIVVLAAGACNLPGIGTTPSVSSPTTGPVVNETIQTANQATATTASTAQPQPSETVSVPAGLVAYVGADGNIWLLDRTGGEPLQGTDDAVLMQPDSTAEPVRYCCMQWSTDGNLLSYLREKSIKVDSGYNYEYDFLVYDTTTSSAHSILAGQTLLGYSWQPGTHLIAYAQPVDPNYWNSPEEVMPDLAQGIWTLDADSGETAELVEPERGLTLANPRWSPDGRFLSFEEVRLMEGRGQFAYYDIQQNRYTATEKTLGSYSWSPDGERVAYDQVSYFALGVERIWINSRSMDAEIQLSPDFASPGYAFAPVFSPAGDRVAYLVNPSEIENMIFNLIVQDTKGGEPRDYGAFEQVWQMHWTADGGHLVFSAGPYDAQQVVELNLADGSVRELAQGSEAVLQP